MSSPPNERPNGVFVFVAVFVIAVAAVGGPMAYLTLQDQGLTISPRVGQTMVYNFFIAQRAPISPTAFSSGLNVRSPILSGDNFYFDFGGSYHQILARASAGSPPINLTTDCQVAAKNLSLIIQPLAYRGGVYTVNSTLSFTDGYASCGMQYSPLPTIAGSWSVVNGSHASVFQMLNITRTAMVNANNSDTSGPGTYPYGGWPFWLGSQDLKSDYALILYNLVDGIRTGLPVEGVANMVPLNASQVAPAPYMLAGREIPAASQIFTTQHIIFPEQVISNVSAEEGLGLMGYFAKITANCPPQLTCTGIFGSGLYPTASYSNGSLYIANSTILDHLSLGGRDWQFSSRLLSGQSSLTINGKNYNTTYYAPGIEYNGTRYVTYGMYLGPMGDLSYSRGGALLYVSSISQGDLSPLLPAVMVRAFGIAFNPQFGGSFISMRLSSLSQ